MSVWFADVPSRFPFLITPSPCSHNHMQASWCANQALRPDGVSWRNHVSPSTSIGQTLGRPWLGRLVDDVCQKWENLLHVCIVSKNGRGLLWPPLFNSCCQVFLLTMNYFTGKPTVLRVFFLGGSCCVAFLVRCFFSGTGKKSRRI